MTAPAAIRPRSIPLWILVVIAIGLSALVRWLDFNASEVQPAVLMLLIFAAVLSFLEPRYAWLIALLLGLSIAATHVIASTAGIQQSFPPTNPITTLVALIPAALGAANGSGRAVRVQSSGSIGPATTSTFARTA